MKKSIAYIELGGATVALLIAVAFMHEYSFYANIETKLRVDKYALSSICVMLRDFSQYLLLLPVAGFSISCVLIS